MVAVRHDLSAAPGTIATPPHERFVLDLSLSTTPATMPEKRAQPVADIDTTLKRVFKKSSFRSVQREVIEVNATYNNSEL